MDLGSRRVAGVVLMIAASALGVTRSHGAPCPSPWSTGVALPTASTGLAAATVGGTVFAIGGFDGSYLQTTQAWDPATGTWSPRANMPTARWFLAAATLGGSIYAVGGAPWLGVLEVYDPATNTWTTKAPMPTGRSGLALAVSGGTLYAIGGFSFGGAGGIATVEAYDPATNSWSTKAPMPTARGELGAVAIGGTIYAVGGEYLNSALAKVEAYDPATDSWTTKANLPTAREEFAVVAIGGTVYSIGGFRATPPTYTYFATVEAYDPATNTWSRKADMPTPRRHHAAATLGGTIYVVGGGNAADSIQDTVEKYDSTALPACLAGKAWSVPSLAAKGSPFTVTFSVTNHGTVNAVGVTPQIELNAGQSIVAMTAGPVPAGPVTVGPGASAVFSWTFTATGNGPVSLTVTVSGTDAASGLPVAASASTTLAVVAPASLRSALSVTPGSGCAGQSITITLTLTNDGDTHLINGNPGLGIGFPATILTYVSGPSPAYPVTIPASSSVGVSWVYQVGAGGPAPFSGSFTATDGVFGTGHSTTAKASGTYADIAQLAATVTAPGTVSSGQVFPVILIASNPGGAGLTGLAGSLTVSGAAASGSSVSGPVPAGPVSLAGGSQQSFTWTLSAGGAGSGLFSLTVSGVEGCTSGAISDAAVAAFQVQSPAALSVAAVAIPATVRQGEEIRVVLTVTNTGQAGAAGLAGSGFAAPAPAGSASYVTGPAPAGSASLGGGMSRSFTWRYVAAASGGVSFTATVSGADANAGWPLSAGGTTGLVTVNPSAFLKATVVPEGGGMIVGIPGRILMTILNAGDHTANAVTPSLGFSDPDSFAVLEGPDPATSSGLPPGGSLTVAWTVRPLKPGSLGLMGSVSGVDAIDAAPVSTQVTGTATVTRKTGDAPVMVYPNPVTGDRMIISMLLTTDAATVDIEAFNPAMERIWRGTWRQVPRWDGEFTLDGMAGWAPGPYLLRIRAVMVDGQDVSYPLVRVVVKR